MWQVLIRGNAHRTDAQERLVFGVSDSSLNLGLGYEKDSSIPLQGLPALRFTFTPMATLIGTGIIS